MINLNLLKEKILEKNLSMELLANKIGIDRATLYRKMTGNGENFKIGEAIKISKILNLNKDEINQIFFKDFVA